MVSVSKRWILDNIQKLYCSSGILDLEDIKDFDEPEEGFETNLDKIEKLEVEKGERRETFRILIPGGSGWAEAFPFTAHPEETSEY
ncbi:hypothetical protein EQO05_14395 [Methanosarcina sp. MSH10X1]|uniref:hypothetical protein n=1 Tax=Methanosarcina sp. MSH10X1 TaxID=2507075 RepID=UPI000FFC32B5|nr:hypothetical protein [Methanosarcina sp. MSH10X1]RXA16230.1 hypothetical protein EQO05_14395 [Methanosarcina sp. MSH10X1]